MSASRRTLIRDLTTSPGEFSRCAIGIPLRPYQQQVVNAVLHSILNHLGLSFVVIFPRQSGKNEAQAHLEAYLLFLLYRQEVEIVSVSPTYRPQAINAIQRLQRCLDRNPFTRSRWHTHAGYTVQLGQACVHFFSGSTVAHTVGATASVLLSIDEAQDIRLSTYDRKFAPMVASTGATRVFWGTPWTSSTLLAREKRRAESEQQKDGLQRLWSLTADDVALVHPIYGEYVSREVSRYGRTHPYIKTQYFSEEIDSQGSMFNPTRLLLIFGKDRPASPVPGAGGEAAAGPAALPAGPAPVPGPQPGLDRSGAETENGEVGGGAVSFLLDLAGQDESRMDFSTDEVPLENPSRDSAALSIASIDLSTLPTLQAPSYTILYRHQWTGCNHLNLFGQLKSLVATWNPKYIVLDATGVGEGLWAMLDKTFPTRVIPVKFNQQLKSELGWKFLSIIDTGRFRVAAGPQVGLEQYPAFDELVRLQYTACRSEVLSGPAKTLRWGVPEGARGPDGQLIHDDFLLADSLVGMLDNLEWYISSPPIWIDGIDPLAELKDPSSWYDFEGYTYPGGRRRY